VKGRDRPRQSQAKGVDIAPALSDQTAERRKCWPQRAIDWLIGTSDVPQQRFEFRAVELGDGPEALPPVEIRPLGGSYDYAARYTPGQTEFHAPARLTVAESKAAAEVAVIAHRALGLRDVSRTDLILCDGEPFFLEVNVAPGMTETSTLPMALDSAGLSLGTVCRDLLIKAAARGT